MRTSVLIISFFVLVSFQTFANVTEIIKRTKTLLHPEDIAVDNAGNVYVTGTVSDNVFKIAPEGVITEIIGKGQRLAHPKAIAVDTAGNVYVTGALSFNAIKITPEGIITEIIVKVFGDGAEHNLSFPNAIAVDNVGNVYVTGGASDNAFKITPAGVITEIIDETVDSKGNVYVTGGDSDNAFKITADGVITEIIDATGDGAGKNLDSPRGIAVDSAGNVYVAGTFSNNVFKIQPIVESISLEAGWNLLSTSQELLMITNPNLSDRIWTWNAKAQRFEIFPNGTAMNSTQGYWIYANNQTILELVHEN